MPSAEPFHAHSLGVHTPKTQTGPKMHRWLCSQHSTRNASQTPAGAGHRQPHSQQVPGSSTWPCLFPSHHHPRACSHARQPCPIISVHLAAEERHAPWSPWAPTAVSQMQALVNATPVPTAPSSSGAACPGHSPHPANWPLQGEHPAFSPCFLYKLRFGMTSPSQ